MVDSTNPKDLLGVKKVSMNLLPAAGRIEGARAMQHGADKYGPYNWREKKVRMTIYLDAIERHLTALYDGEDDAPDSGISHLGHILAGAAILVDAKETGNLIDDRPAKGPAAKMLERYDQSKKEVVDTSRPLKLGYVYAPNGVDVIPDTFKPCPTPCPTCAALGFQVKE